VRRRLIFGVWTIVATVVLLEVVLRIGAVVVRPGPASDVVPDPDAYRVLAVGDSWVAGAEAPAGRGFVDVVAQELPVALGRPVQVVNRGRNGANSAHAATVALDVLPTLKPDAVIVLVGLNNGHNLQGVAELDQRLGVGSGRTRPRLRTLQALRILATNLGLGDGPATVPPVTPMLFADDGACVHGDFAFGTLADASAAELCRGTPVVRAPLLESPAGRGYLERFVDDAPPPSGDALDDLSFALLYASARGEAAAFVPRAASLEAQLGDRPVVDGRTARARYALVRHSREMEDWHRVRRHGGALDAWPQRGLLRDLGAAEARVLAGDWPTARALLVSAHARAPGFEDVVDAAVRFPEPARDGRVHDAIEWPSTRRSLPREVGRRHSRPGLYYSPEVADPAERAFAAMDPGPEPARDAAATEWARHLAGQGGRGGLDAVEAAVRAFAASTSADHAVPLRQAVRALRTAGGCDLLLPTAERWYRVRGDAHGWVRAVSQCLGPAEAASRLRELRADWRPLGRAGDWAALVGSEHDSFALLERHLDAIVEAADGARVLVLSYPNFQGAFGTHRDATAAYAATRPVELVDLFGFFEARYDASAWSALLADGGHCNADGYRVMGEEIVRRLR